MIHGPRARQRTNVASSAICSVPLTLAAMPLGSEALRAHLERAGGDRRAARVGIAARKRQDAGAGLRQAAGAADGAAEGRGAGEVENQRHCCRSPGRCPSVPVPPLPTCRVPAPTVVAPL